MVEITTFRTEGAYRDNRHPDWVKFVDSVESDLARRDYTVNAMAYSPPWALPTLSAAGWIWNQKCCGRWVTP